jgi:hypothetical protein
MRLKEAQAKSTNSIIDIEAKMTYQVPPKKHRKYSTTSDTRAPQA